MDNVEISNRVKELIKLCREEDKRHKLTYDALTNEIEEIQNQCHHEHKTFLSNPMESWYRCYDCNLDL